MHGLIADGEVEDLRDKQIEGSKAAKMSFGKCNDGLQKSDRILQVGFTGRTDTKNK